MSNGLYASFMLALAISTVNAVNTATNTIEGFYKNESEAQIHCSVGKFTTGMEFASDEPNNAREVYYEFEADNGEVSWVLTEEEIGFVPNSNDYYTLWFSDNGTDDLCDDELIRIERGF